MGAPARYYDGKTALAQDVDVRASTLELVIVRPTDLGVVARWPVADLRVLGDPEHEAVPPIARAGSDERLMVEDAALRHRLAASVPALATLGRPRPPAMRRIAQFGGALAAVVALFWVAVDVGSGYVAPLVPHPLQVKLGEAVLGEMTANNQRCTGQQGVAAINALANRLAEASGHPHKITVHLVKGGPVNAFTLPGDILVFYEELIAGAKDSSHVAGVLSHEIGHAVHYHPIKGLVRQYGLDLLMKSLTGGFSELSTLGTGGGILLALRNGRAFERDADATGVALLEKLNLRADGIAGFFEEMLAKAPADAASAAGIWSSHPPTAERIAATKRAATGAPAFSDAEWKALREACP